MYIFSTLMQSYSCQFCDLHHKCLTKNMRYLNRIKAGYIMNFKVTCASNDIPRPIV